ncbi:MAG: YtpI family protein [Bacilli bacterium]
MTLAVGISVVAFVFYVFFKAKAYRTPYPMQKRWIGEKARMALGVFVSTYGINVFGSFDTLIGMIVGGTFIVVGVYALAVGYWQYQTLIPYAREEFDALQGKNT